VIWLVLLEYVDLICDFVGFVLCFIDQLCAGSFGAVVGHPAAHQRRTGHVQKPRSKKNKKKKFLFLLTVSS
jgi:hypothetical protein